MADMEWVRMTHQGCIEGMDKHAKELEQENERHFYGAAIERINLLMEHIEEMEDALAHADRHAEDLEARIHELEDRNEEMEDALYSDEDV